MRKAIYLLIAALALFYVLMANPKSRRNLDFIFRPLSEKISDLLDEDIVLFKDGTECSGRIFIEGEKNVFVWRSGRNIKIRKSGIKNILYNVNAKILKKII